MKEIYYDQLTKPCFSRKYEGYQPPIKTKEDYLSEIRNLEIEIEIAKAKVTTP